MFRLCRMILLAGQILIVSNLFAAVPLPSVASRPRELDFGGMTWRIKSSASAVAPVRIPTAQAWNRCGSINGDCI